MSLPAIESMSASRPGDGSASAGVTDRLTGFEKVWLLALGAVGVFIWWRDRSWLASAGEVLPLLVAFPLFWWCGRPWRWRAGVAGVDRQWLGLAALAWIAGIALNLTVLLALAWTVATWSLLVLRLEPARRPTVARLLPLLWLAFPWLALETDWLGWYFRLSAAGVADRLFGALGFAVERQGVLVVVQGLPISVDPECSGLGVLQAMLIAGLVVAHRQFRASRGYWWVVPALVAAAWCANTLRVLLTTAVALSFGSGFATGRFHVLSGVLVLVLMFLLCLAGFSWVPWLLRFGRERVRGVPYGVRLAALLFCALLCADLVRTWHDSPFDRGGQAMLALWLLPVLAALLASWRTADAGVRQAHIPSLPVLALVLLLVGTATSLNVLKHAALALAAAAFLPLSGWTLLWFGLAVSWMPALGWVASGLGVKGVVGLRLGLSLVAAAAGLLGLRRVPPSRPVSVAGNSWWRPLAVALAAIVTLLWELVPVADSSRRLQDLSSAGLGFSSVDMPLSRTEADVYRTAETVKRLYQMRSGSVLVIAVDGSKDRHAVHDPVYCFRGAGWRLSTRRPFPLPGGAGVCVELMRGSERREAVYWFTDGHSRHASVSRYWWQTSCRRLTFGAWGANPLLVLVQPADGQGESMDWERVFTLIPDLSTL